MSPTPKIVAFVDDLMDRSRVTVALDGVVFARVGGLGSVEPDATVDVVVIDLGKHLGKVGEIRTAFPSARLVGFAPHVDDASKPSSDHGVDAVMARSRFFRDPNAAIVAPDAAS